MDLFIRRTERYPKSAMKSHILEFMPYMPDDGFTTEKSASQSSSMIDHSSALKDRLDILRFTNEDLGILLQLPHASFWSHVLHNNSLAAFFDTYLWYARNTKSSSSSTTSSTTSSSPQKEIDQLKSEISRRVLMLALRMGNRQDSGTDAISEGEYSKLIWDHYVFSTPQLMDLCVIYGPSNKALVSNLISGIFRVQPEYYKDLKHSTLVVTIQALQKTLIQIIQPLEADHANTMIIFLKDCKFILFLFFSFINPNSHGSV